MADSKRNTSSRYVRSAYRRSGPGQPDYGQSNSRGQIWSVIIVLLLIVVLTGGAIWMYLGRQDEAVIPRDELALRGEEEPPEEVAPRTREREAVVPREEPAPGEEEVEPRPREEVAEPREDVAPPPREEEDEFAALLEELGITEERERREPAPAEPREEPAPREEVEPRPREEVAEPREDVAPPPREEEEVAIFEEEVERTAREREERWARLEEEELPQTITVRPGDSLSRIAGRVYGDINKWRLIYEANRDRLEDPDRLLVGMELKVPAREN